VPSSRPAYQCTSIAALALHASQPGYTSRHVLHLLQAAEERASAAENRSRELYEANQRLEAHVHDLESRKRAPLYQKKQEASAGILIGTVVV
jgi:hypothetical protein